MACLRPQTPQANTTVQMLSGGAQVVNFLAPRVLRLFGRGIVDFDQFFQRAGELAEHGDFFFTGVGHVLFQLDDLSIEQMKHAGDNGAAVDHMPGVSTGPALGHPALVQGDAADVMPAADLDDRAAVALVFGAHRRPIDRGACDRFCQVPSQPKSRPAVR